MKPVFRIALKSFLLNVLSCLLLFADLAGIIFIGISIVAQLLIGIVLVVDRDKRAEGQGVLLGMGVFILVGFSVCTMMLNGLH